MTRTPFCALALALALSACGSDAGVGNTATAAGNGSIDLQAGKAGGSAAPSQSTPVSTSNPPSAAQPGGATTSVGMAFGKPLGPLLDEDHHSPDKMGCNCTFNGAAGTYLSVIDGELMVRTPAGIQHCPIPNPQLEALGKADRAVSCGGVRMTIRETGARTSDVEADSSDAPATLSARGQGSNGTLDGTWGCAC